MLLLCDRPHEKTLDFDTARFVVGKSCGINVGGQRLERGDLVPEGVLNSSALREMYDTPLALIEVVEHSIKDPGLMEAMIVRGTFIAGFGFAEGGEVPAQEPAIVGENSVGQTVAASPEDKSDGQSPSSWAQSLLAKPESSTIDPKAEVERLRRENEALRKKKGVRR